MLRPFLMLAWLAGSPASAADGELLFPARHLTTLDRSHPAATELRRHTEQFLVDQLGGDPDFLDPTFAASASDRQIRARVRNNVFDLVEQAEATGDLTAVWQVVEQLVPQSLPAGMSNQDYNQNLYLGMLGTYADAEAGRMAWAGALRSMALLSVLDTTRSRRRSWKSSAYLLSTLTVIHPRITTFDTLIPESDAVGLNAGRAAIIARAYFPVFWAWDLTRSRSARFTGATFQRDTPAGGVVIHDYEQFLDDALVRFQQEYVRGIRLWEDEGWFNDSHYNNHLAAHLLGLATIGRFGMNRSLAYAHNPNARFGGRTNPRPIDVMIEGAILMEDDDTSGSIEVNYREHDHPLHFNTLVDGDIYDRYRTRGEGQGITYSMLSLDLLTITATILERAGVSPALGSAPSRDAFLGLGHARMSYIFGEATSEAWLFANTVFDYDQNGHTEYSKYIVGDPRQRSYFALGRAHYCRNLTFNALLTTVQDDALCGAVGRALVEETDWPLLTHHHPLLGPVNYLLGID